MEANVPRRSDSGVCVSEAYQMEKRRSVSSATGARQRSPEAMQATSLKYHQGAGLGQDWSKISVLLSGVNTVPVISI